MLQLFHKHYSFIFNIKAMIWSKRRFVRRNWFWTTRVFSVLFWWDDFYQWCSEENSCPLGFFLLPALGWVVSVWRGNRAEWAVELPAFAPMSLPVIPDGLCYCRICVTLELYSLAWETSMSTAGYRHTVGLESERNQVVCLCGNSVTEGPL